MKIKEIRITPSAPAVGVVGENFTLQCTVYVLQPNSSSKYVTSTLKWLQSPSSALPTYKTVVQVFNPTVTATGTAYYTQLQSTIQFSPLQASDAGTASCQLGDNEALAASINITVNGMEYFSFMQVLKFFLIFSSKHHSDC